MSNSTVPHNTNSDERMTSGQFRDLASAMVQLTPHDLPRARAGELIGNKGAWQDELRRVLWGQELAKSANFGLECWERRYRDRFNRRIETSGLVIPNLPVGTLEKPSLLVVDPTLLLNQVYDAMGFLKWRCVNDLDAAHKMSQPRPKQLYAVWVDGGVEPSARWQGLSPDQLDQQKLIYETILERELHEIVFHEETAGGHLDLEMWTITSSRYSDGNAFSAGWLGGQFEVSSWDRDSAPPNGRPRQVVVSL